MMLRGRDCESRLLWYNVLQTLPLQLCQNSYLSYFILSKYRRIGVPYQVYVSVFPFGSFCTNAVHLIVHVCKAPARRLTSFSHTLFRAVAAVVPQLTYTNTVKGKCLDFVSRVFICARVQFTHPSRFQFKQCQTPRVLVVDVTFILCFINAVSFLTGIRFPWCKLYLMNPRLDYSYSDRSKPSIRVPSVCISTRDLLQSFITSLTPLLS